MACSSLYNNFSDSIGFYDAGFNQKEMFVENLVSDVKTSFENNSFIVYYQPKYDISGSRPRLSSAEALIRWNHPRFGMATPRSFIPLS